MPSPMFPLIFPRNFLLFMRSVIIPNQPMTNTKIITDYKVSVFVILKIDGDEVRSQLDFIFKFCKVGSSWSVKEAAKNKKVHDKESSQSSGPFCPALM